MGLSIPRGSLISSSTCGFLLPVLLFRLPRPVKRCDGFTWNRPIPLLAPPVVDAPFLAAPPLLDGAWFARCAVLLLKLGTQRVTLLGRNA